MGYERLLLEKYITEIGLMVNFKEKENMRVTMENILDLSSGTRRMVEEPKYSLMDQFIQESGKKGFHMGKENLNGQMEIFILVIFLMGLDMVKVCKNTAMAMFMKENG